MGDPAILGTIEQLYEAALLPAQWPHALDTLARTCGAVGISVSRGPIPEPALASPSIEASTAAYAATWWEHDSRTQRLTQAFRGQPLTDSDLFTEEERRTEPYYQEFLKGFGLGSFIGTLVSPLPGLRYVLNLEGDAEPFGGAQVETFAVLAPHVSRALATTARLGLTEAYSGDLATALEHTPCGMIFLTPNGQVSFTNDRTERLLGDGLTIEGRTLRSASPDDQAALDALVSSILPGSVRAMAEVLVARPSGRGPLLVQGVPIRPRQDRYYERLGIATGGGLLLVQDLAGEGGRSVGADLRRLGLTPAQARVAELVGSGYSPREAASEIGIVESTARAQLKQAYARLGLSKQSELAILVTKLCTIQR